jgi:acyl-CoA synthetase (AMP-forming)/AMP-acid ligase II
VVGVPDDLQGEAITALVVLKEGATLGPDPAAVLRAFCTERLPKYKVRLEAGACAVYRAARDSLYVAQLQALVSDHRIHASLMMSSCAPRSH